MTLQMFEFDNIMFSADLKEVFTSCHIVQKYSFFQGHFDGQPLMPAAAQIQMLTTLIDNHTNWKINVTGGCNIKFTKPIVPNDVINIHLAKNNEMTLFLNLSKDDVGTVTKGKLTFVSKDID